MLDVLKKKIQAAAIDHMSPIRLDLMEDVAPATTFDVIYTMLTLHHIDDTERILRIFHTLLAEHGCLFIADLDKEDGSFHRAGFEGHNGFDRQKLQTQLEGAGFSEIRYETCYTITKEVDSGATKAFPVFLMTCKKPT